MGRLMLRAWPEGDFQTVLVQEAQTNGWPGVHRDRAARARYAAWPGNAREYAGDFVKQPLAPSPASQGSRNSALGTTAAVVLVRYELLLAWDAPKEDAHNTAMQQLLRRIRSRRALGRAYRGNAV